MKEGESISHYSLLDGINYGYWNVWMCVFIKSLDMKACRSVLIGWCPPTKIDDDGKTMVKSNSNWTSEEDKSITSNWMALNVIEYGVDSRHFKIIETSKSAKEAWETLQVIHEGNKEREDQISEPVALITHLKIVEGQKEEVLEEVSIDVLTHPVLAQVYQDVRTLYGSDEEEDEIFDEGLAQSYKVLYENRIDVVKLNKTL